MGLFSGLINPVWLDKHSMRLTLRSKIFTALTFGIFDDLSIVSFHNSDARVRRAQVDSDDTVQMTQSKILLKRFGENDSKSSQQMRWFDLRRDDPAKGLTRRIVFGLP